MRGKLRAATWSPLMLPAHFNEARALCAGNWPASGSSAGPAIHFNEARALCAGNWSSLQPAPPAARKPPMREVVANGPERTFPCARFGESIVLIV